MKRPAGESGPFREEGFRRVDAALSIVNHDALIEAVVV
jgi:hypothetical protein